MEAISGGIPPENLLRPKETLVRKRRDARSGEMVPARSREERWRAMTWRRASHVTPNQVQWAATAFQEEREERGS